MKKLAILAVLAVIFASFAAADVNFEKLKAAHMVAMKYHGHATLAAERDASMIFMSIDKGIASVCYGKEMASAYMEKGNSKFYWTVEKTQSGVLISSKVNVNGVKYSRTVEVSINEGEVSIRQRTDLDEGARVSCDWGCLAKKFFGCISCFKDWKCWLSCAGPGIWECCSL